MRIQMPPSYWGSEAQYDSIEESRRAIREAMASVDRFQADPAKVRVSVRPHCRRWLATVMAREDPDVEYTGWQDTPEEAVAHALATAAHDGLDGIDLSMGRAYDHPFGAAGVENRKALDEAIRSDQG
jgi:hypothetical protein